MRPSSSEKGASTLSCCTGEPAFTTHAAAVDRGSVVRNLARVPLGACAGLCVEIERVHGGGQTGIEGDQIVRHVHVTVVVNPLRQNRSTALETTLGFPVSGFNSAFNPRFINSSASRIFSGAKTSISFRITSSASHKFRVPHNAHSRKKGSSSHPSMAPSSPSSPRVCDNTTATPPSWQS